MPNNFLGLRQPQNWKHNYEKKQWNNLTVFGLDYNCLNELLNMQSGWWIFSYFGFVDIGLC